MKKINNNNILIIYFHCKLQDSLFLPSASNALLRKFYIILKTCQKLLSSRAIYVDRILFPVFLKLYFVSDLIEIVYFSTNKYLQTRPVSFSLISIFASIRLTRWN